MASRPATSHVQGGILYETATGARSGDDGRGWRRGGSCFGRPARGSAQRLPYLPGSLGELAATPPAYDGLRDRARNRGCLARCRRDAGGSAGVVPRAVGVERIRLGLDPRALGLLARQRGFSSIL